MANPHTHARQASLGLGQNIVSGRMDPVDIHSFHDGLVADRAGRDQRLDAALRPHGQTVDIGRFYDGLAADRAARSVIVQPEPFGR